MPAIAYEVIAQAHADAAVSGRRTLDVLEENLGLSATDFLSQLADTFRYPILTLEDFNRLKPAFDLLPYSLATQRECLAFYADDGVLILVSPDPFAASLQTWAEEQFRLPLLWHLAHRADVQTYLAQHEDSLSAMESVLKKGQPSTAQDKAVEELSLKSIGEDSSPVVKLINSTLYDALKIGASDIHLETNATGLTIRNRIDGVLVTIGEAQGITLAEQALSRVKIMAELDITERRIPQDGRFQVVLKGREVDFRVSVMPSLFGEDAVLRILDKRSLSDELKGLSLEALGYDGDILIKLRKLATEPYGMLLVTGPTGSGKTTTLYASISEINTGLDKIITIEDPVEYQLPGVLQIPVNEKKGLTFARGLRSILRHDPDKIMVGEIRDPETAQIAIQSALTGHLVFTTVHANNVFDVISRFIHMGVEPYSFVSAVNGVVAQRLVRLSCPHCSATFVPDEKLLSASGITPEQARQFNFKRGRGCVSCRSTGYKGRKAIAELLLLNDELRELIVAKDSIRRMKEAARSYGMRSLREAALDLVQRGETTLEEINRVTFVA